MEQIQPLEMIGRFQTVKNSKTNRDLNQENCVFIHNGFCKTCFCDNCIGGNINTKGSDGMIHTVKCDCMKKAYSQHMIESNGLTNLMELCTFDTYRTDEDWQRKVKDKATAYTQEWKKNSFFISGQTGSGKTHICLAVLNAIQPPNFCYMQWIGDIGKLKDLKINDYRRYEEQLKSFQVVQVLYIDDFFKGSVSDADVKLACEIIYYRYQNGLPMIVSSEKDMDTISNIPECEALAGRLYQMSSNGKYVINLKGADKNQRFKP